MRGLAPLLALTSAEHAVVRILAARLATWNAHAAGRGGIHALCSLRIEYLNCYSRWQGLGSHHIVPKHAVSSGLVEEICVEVQGTLPSAPMLRQLQHKVQLPYAGYGLHR